MEVLTELWDKTTDAFTALSENVSEGLVRIFGSSNERRIRSMRPLVATINELEPQMQALSDDELKAKTVEFRGRRAAGETLDDLLPEAFAACRESGRRFLNMRHFDVQLMGGMVLHGGDIAEMVTGEGKTLVATLAAYLNALEGKGVHVVTVNDYLARRDAEWMSPLFRGLGMTVGAIQSEMESTERQQIYGCDITYGTNNEFGFDYLRDNMKPVKDYQCQGELHYAIIDEVDSILIDEARTPLIISGPAFDDVRKYAEADRIARLLKRDLHFEVKEKERTCHLNDEGIREAEKVAGVESFYTPGNMEWPHLIDNSLKAHHLYRRDRDYVVQPNGEVVIVDEFTGRLMIGRQWSDGLHQAVEAKERVKIKEENQTLATITLQNFFKLYKKLAGMTGTAMTEATEFYKVYGLDVIAIPTNRPLTRRQPCPTSSSGPSARRSRRSSTRSRRSTRPAGRSWSARPRSRSRKSCRRCSEPVRHHAPGPQRQVPRARGRDRGPGRPPGGGDDRHQHGRPRHRHHPRRQPRVHGLGRPEAADRRGRPPLKYETRLDVPKDVWEKAVAKYEPEMKAEGREVAAVGGLHIIGTERHESRRIDNQLRGRAGRQGDPGSSRFFLSLEDDLMRKFAGEWVSAVLTRLGMQEGEAIESRMVSRRIEGAQKKVEERNFDIRKNLLEYDEVMDEQRKRVYSFRQSLLEGSPPKDKILEMIDNQIKDAADRFLADDYGAASFAEWVGQRLGVELTARDLKGASFEDAGEIVRTKAERQLHETIREAIEENLPSDCRSLRVDLAGAGELGQQPLRAEPQGEGPQEVRPPGRGRVRVRPRGSRGVPAREGQRLDREARPEAGPRVPRARLGPPFAGRLGPSQVRARDRPASRGRVSTGPRSSGRLQDQAAAALRPQGGRAAGPDRPHAVPGRSLTAHASTLRSRGPGGLGVGTVPHDHRRRRDPAAVAARDRGAPARAGSQSLPGSRALRRARSQARRGLSACSGREKHTATADAAALADLASWAQEPGRRDDRRRAGHSVPRRRTSLAGQRPRRQAPARNARDGKGRSAPDPRLELDGAPPGHGPPAELDRPAGLRPDRPQGRVQARGHADLRRDVERHRRPRRPT